MPRKEIWQARQGHVGQPTNNIGQVVPTLARTRAGRGDFTAAELQSAFDLATERADPPTADDLRSHPKAADEIAIDLEE